MCVCVVSCQCSSILPHGIGGNDISVLTSPIAWPTMEHASASSSSSCFSGIDFVYLSKVHTICSENESVPESLILSTLVSSSMCPFAIIFSDLYPSLKADIEFMLWSTSTSLPISDRAREHGVMASTSASLKVGYF